MYCSRLPLVQTFFAGGSFRWVFAQTTQNRRFPRKYTAADYHWFQTNKLYFHEEKSCWADQVGPWCLAPGRGPKPHTKLGESFRISWITETFSSLPHFLSESHSICNGLFEYNSVWGAEVSPRFLKEWHFAPNFEKFLTWCHCMRPAFALCFKWLPSLNRRKRQETHVQPDL